MNIKIEPLTLSNFNEHSLDDFRRRQQVTEVWRRNGNEMELVYQPFVEDWDADVRREAAEGCSAICGVVISEPARSTAES